MVKGQGREAVTVTWNTPFSGKMNLGKPPVLTTVHPIQIVEKIPAEDHNILLDWILILGEVIETSTDRGKPDGINWTLLDEEDLEEIPLLKRLKNFGSVPDLVEVLVLPPP